jgi:hypothetical protein
MVFQGIRRRRLLPLAVVVAALALAGCGDDDPTADAAAAEAPDRPPAATEGEESAEEGPVDTNGGQDSVDAVDALGLDGVARIIADQYEDVTGYRVDGDRVIFEHAAVDVEEVGMVGVCLVADSALEAASEVVVEFPSGQHTCP